MIEAGMGGGKGVEREKDFSRRTIFTRGQRGEEARRGRKRNVSLASYWCIFRVTSLRHGTTSRKEAERNLVFQNDTNSVDLIIYY